MSINWKKTKNKWSLSKNSDINFSLFNEFNTPTNTPNTSLLYLPVHNVNDIYEWYRIFNDAYNFSDPLAQNHIDNLGHGIGITLYSNKDRAKTIKAWFPNLVEVKATSTDELTYYYDGINYIKNSIDFMTNFDSVTNTFTIGSDNNLLIDNTFIHVGEKVLLKNQFKSRLKFIIINDMTLAHNYLIYDDYLANDYINYISSIDQINYKINLRIDKSSINDFNFLFKNNSTLVTVYKDNTIKEFKIKTVDIVSANLSNTDLIDIKITLDTTDDIKDILMVADKYNGKYENDNYLKNQNGVYVYDGTLLMLLEDMNMEEKVYNQNVYTYQGETNQNKVFYLRRNEDRFTDMYSKFPCTKDGVHMNYSLGDPHLVECEVNYDIAMNPIDYSNVSQDCSAYNSNFNYLNHPTGPGPFTLTDNIFRLLYTDYDVARKLQLKSNVGPADFKILDPVTLYDNAQITYDIKFPVSTNEYNYLKKYLESKNITTCTSIDFVSYDETTHTNKIEGNITNIINSTNYVIEYNRTNISLPIVTLPIDPLHNINYSFINLKINAYETTQADPVSFVIEEEIYVTNIVDTSGVVTFDTEQLFTPELIDDLYYILGTGGEITFEIEFLNCFSDKLALNETTLQLELNVDEVIKSINKTVIGRTFEFIRFSDNLNITAGINLHKLRNSSFVYHDMTQEIISDFTSSNIEGNYYPVYDANYNMSKYMTQYMNYLNSDILDTRPKLDIKHFSLDDTDPEYFEVIKTHQDDQHGNDVYEGTIIKYGVDHKLNFIMSLKSNSYIKINGEDNFIISNEFDYDTKIGTIILNDTVISSNDPTVVNGVTTMYFDPHYNIGDISTLLKETFDVTNNIANNVIEDPTDPTLNESAYKVMKPSTYSIANDIINKRQMFPDLTGVVYKEFNELVYTFFKRDKKFRFDDTLIIDVSLIVTDELIVGTDMTIVGNQVNIIPMIHGYTMNLGDTIIISGQTNKAENGKFEVTEVFPTVLTRTMVNSSVYYRSINGPVATLLYYAYYQAPYELAQTDIYFFQNLYSRKSDPRLNITFKKYARLGVDNDYQPFREIEHNNDSIEIIENLVSVGTNVNASNAIRFIDGLSFDNILNNYNGQGVHAWILHPNVVTENAVVGVNSAGKLIWYKGKWVNGVWCDGIWIQGTWVDGIWVNGEMYSYGVTDYISYVDIDYNTDIQYLTIWQRGTWVSGDHYNGIMNHVLWKTGIFHNGIIRDGIWDNGEFRNGIFEYLYWKNGEMINGDFQTGVWEKGTMYGGIFGSNATITSDYKTRAIIFNGTFLAPSEITTSDKLSHTATIIYNGIFEATLTSGTIVGADYNRAIINGGIIIGGYYMTPFINPLTPTKQLFSIDPKQWDLFLGLTTNINYIPNQSHNYETRTGTTITVMGKKITPNPIAEFPNDLLNTSVSPSDKVFSVDSSLISSDTISINMDALTAGTYIQPDNLNNFSINGRPFITNYINNPSTQINKSVILKCFMENITIKNSIILEHILLNCVIE